MVVSTIKPLCLFCLMKQLSDIYSYLITWDQIDEPKLFSVSRFCGHFVVYSCVGSFLFLFCCFSHSPFLLGRNALCFQRFHFTNWSLKCLAAWMIITGKSFLSNCRCIHEPGKVNARNKLHI